MKDLIIKIQRPTQATGPWLLFDQTRGLVYRSIPRREMPADVIDRIGAAPMVFWHAILVGTTLHFIRPAPAQDW